MDQPSRCLSVRQPWAWAICVGEKTIENRTWSTDYRGTIAIQASASKSTVNSFLKPHKSAGIAPAFFSCGAIIGVADVVDCVELNPDLESDPWAEGTICWKLDNARFIADPIPMKGKLNLFVLAQEIGERLSDQLQLPQPPVNEALARKVLDIVRVTPDDLCLDRAVAYGELCKFQDAIRLSSRVVEKEPANAGAYRVRAIALLETGEFSGALADADKSVELEPSFFGGYYYRALAKNELGDDDGLRQDYAKARELNPDLLPFEEAFEED
ncbi:MAG: ASCH domain-containing protein [Planctomycetes bacterium]|nr:ASCH domain-containing protein [Planctomycetota bacterium]MBL7037735.1 ASCH domain-containing protein [Pirellulaceae bacterium]